MARKLLTLVEQYHWPIVVALSIVILLAGVVYSLSMGDRLNFVDEHEYVRLATNMVEYHAFTLDGIHPTAYRPVGYPGFLHVFVLAGLGVVSMRIFNFILLSCCTLLLYSLVKRMYGNLAGVVASLMVCLYPALFYTCGVLVPQALGAFLLLVTLKLILTEEWSAFGRYFLAGLLWGVQVLAAPSFIFAFFVFALWPVWTLRSAKSIALGATFVIGTAIAVLPWTARNYQTFGKVVLVSTNSGWNLLLGNNDLTTPNVGANVIPNNLEGIQKGLDEVQLDSAYSRMAIEYITNHKAQSFKMYILKLVNFFYSTDALSGQVERNRLRDFVMLATYGPLLVLGILRLLLFRKLKLSNAEQLLFVIYCGSALFFAIYFTRIRFRVPFDLLLIGIDAILLAFLIQQKKIVSDLRYGPIA